MNKLGEDRFEGVCSEHPDGTRYEDRVDFDSIYKYLLEKCKKDGVLFRPFEDKDPKPQTVEEKGPKKKASTTKVAE